MERLFTSEKDWFMTCQILPFPSFWLLPRADILCAILSTLTWFSNWTYSTLHFNGSISLFDRFRKTFFMKTLEQLDRFISDVLMISSGEKARLRHQAGSEPARQAAAIAKHHALVFAPRPSLRTNIGTSIRTIINFTAKINNAKECVL